MDSNSLQRTSPQAPPPASGLPRAVWLTGGVLVLVISGLASALVFKGSDEADGSSLTAVAEASKPAQKTSQSATTQRPVAKAVPATCANCGVVQSVQTIQKKGDGTGVGAIAGGVIGGVVGNQMGGGNGKKAMTVLGALGGGIAGNQVEKHVRSETAYNVTVRMNDGTLRTLTLDQATVSRGDSVAVEGQSLRKVNS